MERQAVVNIRTDAYERYIGRGAKGAPSKWGNPFKVGVHGERGECVELYKEWILRGDGRHLLPQVLELEGQTLGCFCAPKGGATSQDPWVCHGQVLLALIEHARKKLDERN